MEQQYYDAIIVGAGIAGLTAGAYLSRNGQKILICEKSEKAGGLVSSFMFKGFVFDAGIRAFENSGIIFPMVKDLGLDIEFVENIVSIGIEQQMIKLHSFGSLFEYQSMLTEIFPQNATEIEKIIGEIEKVMHYMKVLYGIDNPLFIDYRNDTKYLIKTLLPWLLNYQLNIRKVRKLNAPINRYLGQFTDNKSLIDMITQHFFKNTPTFFALSYFSLYLEYSYPIGGTGVLIDKLLHFIEDHQGEIIFHTDVVNIDPERNIISTKNGEHFGYKKLIWAGDMKSLYSSIDLRNHPNLKQHQNILQQKDLISTSSGGDSILTVYMGVDLDKDYFDQKSGPHCFYTPSKDGLSRINTWENIICKLHENDSECKEELLKWVINYLKFTTYEISCPAIRDSSLAPEGKCGVIVSTLMDYRLVKYMKDKGWYMEFKNLCTDHVIQVLDHSIFPQITEKVLFTLCSTPLTIERLTGNSDGAITGWAFTNIQLPAENRFQKISQAVNTPIPNLFQAGQWSFSPSGLPISILTGKIAADVVCKELNKESKI